MAVGSSDRCAHTRSTYMVTRPTHSSQIRLPAIKPSHCSPVEMNILADRSKLTHSQPPPAHTSTPVTTAVQPCTHPTDKCNMMKRMHHELRPCIVQGLIRLACGLHLVAPADHEHWQDRVELLREVVLHLRHLRHFVRHDQYLCRR